MLKNSTPVLFLVFSLITLSKNCIAQEPLSSDSIGNALSASFKIKDAKYLKPFLAKKFTVGVHSRPTAENLVQVIVNQFPFDSLAQGQTESINNKKRIKFTLYSKGKTYFPQAWLNEQNELLYFDLFDKLYGIDKYQKSVLKAKIPFQLLEGSIILTAKLNNSSRIVNLLFDTGADGMALNKKVADSIGLTISRQQNTSMVGASRQINISSGNTVHLDTLKIPDNNIAIFDNVSEKYDGILGVTLASKFIVKVDFDNQVMELYSMGEYNYEKEGAVIDISFPGGIPEVKTKIKVGNKEAAGEFVFDTGAGYYAIAFSPFVKANSLIAVGFLPYFSGSTISMGHSSGSLTGNFSGLDAGLLGMKNFPGTLQVPDASSEKWINPENGSIGIKTIKRFNFTINLVNHTIHLAPNKNFYLPFDFVLSGLYLSFNAKRQLFIERIVKANLEDRFREGDIILSINNIKTAEMLKKPEIITQFLQAAGKKYSIHLNRDGEILKEEL